jgi:ankyrin repeat protein
MSDLSVQIANLNQDLDQGKIDEDEYNRRAAPLFVIGDVIQALVAGDGKKSLEILKANPSLPIGEVSQNNLTALHVAISSAIKGKLGADVIDALLQAKCPVDAVHNGSTPLFRICDANPFPNAVSVAKSLIRGGANVRFASKGTNLTSLSAAIQRGHPTDLISVLLDAKADPNVSLESGPILNHAAIYDLTDLALLLLKAGADPNSREPEQGSTPLASAISSYNVELVKALVSSGADKTLPIMRAHKATPKDLAARLANDNPGDDKFQTILKLVQ